MALVSAKRPALRPMSRSTPKVRDGFLSGRNGRVTTRRARPRRGRGRVPLRSRVDIRIISIGTLAAHPLWHEREPTRSGHATSTLIRSADLSILVDPGLPAQIMAARLNERSGLEPGAITHVFLTRFCPETTRGLGAFEHATWWIGEVERETTGAALAGELRRAHDAQDHELSRVLQRDVAMLRACNPCPDTLTDGVSLFPLPGVTPGLCGLVLSQALATTLVCGDAIATIEHLEQGKVLGTHADVERARESFAEAVEIADVLILGRDNMVVNRARRSPF